LSKQAAPFKQLAYDEGAVEIEVPEPIKPPRLIVVAHSTAFFALK